MTFADFCIMMFMNIIVLTFFLTVCSDDSKLQKYRLRCSIENIYNYIISNTKAGQCRCELNIIHKNKKFGIGIIENEVNDHYKTYTIFINGDDAAIYHQLTHFWGCSYYYQAVNKRHKDEVISILHAGNKVIKKLQKSKEEKKDGWSEYSYFK